MKRNLQPLTFKMTRNCAWTVFSNSTEMLQLSFHFHADLSECGSPNLWRKFLEKKIMESLHCRKDENIIVVLKSVWFCVVSTLMSTKESHVLFFVTHFQFPEVIFMREYQKILSFSLMRKLTVGYEPTLKVLRGRTWCWTQPIFKSNWQKLLLCFVYCVITKPLHTNYNNII